MTTSHLEACMGSYLFERQSYRMGSFLGLFKTPTALRCFEKGLELSIGEHIHRFILAEIHAFAFARVDTCYGRYAGTRYELLFQPRPNEDFVSFVRLTEPERSYLGPSWLGLGWNKNEPVLDPQLDFFVERRIVPSIAARMLRELRRRSMDR